MMCEQKLELIFIDYLKEQGFPEESIIREVGNFSPFVDLAIIPFRSEMPIAVFEFKLGREAQIFKSGIEALIKQKNLLGFSCPCYLVLDKDEAPFFQIYDVSSFVHENKHFKLSGINECALKKLPKYEILFHRADVSAKTNIKRKKIKYSTWLKYFVG